MSPKKAYWIFSKDLELLYNKSTRYKETKNEAKVIPRGKYIALPAYILIKYL